MHKLIVNPGTAEAFELELKPGINSLGRGPDNDLLLEHESVASRHCEIHVGETEITILDLDSSGGTFVEGNRVEQVALQDGQGLRLGQVAMQFCADLAATGARPGQVAPLPVSLDCRFHPTSPARYFCNQCAKAYCALCVGHQIVNGQNLVTCHKCGSPCGELALVVEQAEPLPFRELALGAFKYPLQGDGWVLLAAGTLFYLLLSFLQRLAGLAGPYGFVAALTLAIFGAGYLVAYLQKIVSASAMGEDRMPDWPDFANWQDDIVAPLLQTAGLIAVCLWPALLGSFLAPKEQPAALPVLIALWVLGLTYLPMAMLAVYMADTITAVNPLIVVPAIFRLRSHYWIVCALLAAVVVAGWLLQAGLEVLLPIPIVPSLLSGFAGLYFLMVEMRILGLMHWCNRERLGWVKGV